MVTPSLCHHLGQEEAGAEGGKGGGAGCAKVLGARGGAGRETQCRGWGMRFYTPSILPPSLMAMCTGGGQGGQGVKKCGGERGFKCSAGAG